MIYKLSRDAQSEMEVKEDEFKTSVFANNPELYNSLFGEKANYLDEDEIEYTRPENDDDFRKLMRELKQVGVIN